MNIVFEETAYGFKYGAAEITRLHSNKDKGWVVIGVYTPRHTGGIQIYVTRTGKVRVHGSDGKEWKP